MKLSIIIPTFRDWDDLSACMEALTVQTCGADFFEILIINNSPETSVPERFKIPNNARIVNESKKGSYAARNLGLKLAKGELIGFTDSDCLPEPNWIANALEYFNNSDIHLVGGKVELYQPSDGDRLTYLYEKCFSFNQKRNVEQHKQSITANLFCRRIVPNTIGDFAETLLSGGDFEWTRRATGSGFKIIYGENVIIKHPARRNLSEMVKKKKRTIGGMYTRFYKDYTFFQKLNFTIRFVRPHVKIFTYKNLSVKEKSQLFFATWYVECIGMKEMFLLDFKWKQAERT
ncbi:glycosyltransferase family A protein [Algoriphagus halophytocola]|uniref:glycosyltransferase n=1 Tax=Algoriphagus halophytocola TaxID=2991499 RepID=UPI0022DE4186|nr:glycosyltransferase family A protein [Algoriphagus sp. TR-M9]WBL44326.1 glycosyltransferase family A protein [Algoriphagus sp. TR-M9]